MSVTHNRLNECKADSNFGCFMIKAGASSNVFYELCTKISEQCQYTEVSLNIRLLVLTVCESCVLWICVITSALQVSLYLCNKFG